MIKLFFTFIASLFMSFAVYAQEGVDTILPAFTFIIDAIGVKWSQAIIVVGALAALLEVIKIVFRFYEAYCLMTPDKRDDEKLAKFKEHKVTKVILFFLGLCGAYVENKKVKK